MTLDKSKPNTKSEMVELLKEQYGYDQKLAEDCAAIMDRHRAFRRQRRPGRFGHNPEPAIDFCIEVDCLEALVRNVYCGLDSKEEVAERLFKAMLFSVGGDEGAVKAKARLRELEKMLDAAPAAGAVTSPRINTERVKALLRAIIDSDPNDGAADAVTVLDVWRKEAKEILEWLEDGDRLSKRQDAVEAATWKYEELRKDGAVTYAMSEALKVYNRMASAIPGTCSICQGDCGSANPPVPHCLMRK